MEVRLAAYSEPYDGDRHLIDRKLVSSPEEGTEENPKRFLLNAISSKLKRFMVHFFQNKYISDLNQSFPESFILVITV